MDEWAELFKKAGARFAGSVAEHHDGFSMWDSQVNRWNAAKMGPKKNVVGELEKAVRGQGMHYMTAFHHAENWKFYPHWVKEYDTSFPQYADLYGEARNMEWGSQKRYIPEPIRFGNTMDGAIDLQWIAQDLPNKAFHEKWFAKLKEVMDAYYPDYIWFDFGLAFISDLYQRKFLTYYYEEAAWRSNGNVHRGNHYLGNEATREYEDSRRKTAQFMNAGSVREVIFTKGATEAVNLVACAYAEQETGENDEIIVGEV